MFFFWLFIAYRYGFVTREFWHVRALRSAGVRPDWLSALRERTDMPRNSLGSNRYEKKKKKKRNNNRPIPYGIFSSTVWDGEREEKDFHAKIWPKVRPHSTNSFSFFTSDVYWRGFFFVKIASSTTRCERKDKLYWYAGMRRMCANKQGELCEADTKGVDLRSGRGNRGLGHFPPSSKRNNFPLIRVYVEGGRRVFYIIRCHGLTPRPPALKTFGFADECRLCRSFGSLITIKAPIWFSTVSVERKSRPTWSESPLDTLQSLSFSFREMDTDCHPAEKYLDDGLRCISRCSPSSGQLPRCFLIWTELTIYSLSQKKNLGNGFFRGPTTGGLITGTREREFIYSGS